MPPHDTPGSSESGYKKAKRHHVPAVPVCGQERKIEGEQLFDAQSEKCSGERSSFIIAV